jgi:hypothetical protein
MCNLLLDHRKHITKKQIAYISYVLQYIYIYDYSEWSTILGLHDGGTITEFAN